MYAAGSLFIGGLFGGLVGWRYGLGIFPGLLLGALVGFLTVRLVLAGAVKLVMGGVVQSGKSTPRKREYSHAESLAVRGEFKEAIAAYEQCCREFPRDPEPYLRIARLYRDELKRYEAAALWFGRARADAKIDAGRELMATQELIELYQHKLHSPRKAIAELALLCRKFPGTPAADAAERELREMRTMLAREDEDAGSLTAQFRKRRGGAES